MTDWYLIRYVDELSTSLELRDAPTDLIDDVVRQVESHVHETGEDPYEAFGWPRDYAKEFAPKARTTSFWTLVVTSTVLASAGGWLLTHGIVNVVADRPILWRADPWYGVAVGGLLIVVWAVALGVATPVRRLPLARHGSQDAAGPVGRPGGLIGERTPRPASASFWVRFVVSLVLAGPGGWFLVYGLMNLADSTPILGGIDPWYAVIYGGMAIFAWLLVTVLSRPRHPTTRTDRHPHD